MRVQDQKNILLGQLFTHAAMAQSGRLVEPTAAADAISALLTVAQKRSFLAESATSVILDVFDQIPPESVSKVTYVHPGSLHFFMTANSHSGRTPARIQAKRPNALVVTRMSLQMRVRIDHAWG